MNFQELQKTLNLTKIIDHNDVKRSIYIFFYNRETATNSVECVCHLKRVMYGSPTHIFQTSCRCGHTCLVGDELEQLRRSIRWRSTFWERLQTSDNCHQTLRTCGRSVWSAEHGHVYTIFDGVGGVETHVEIGWISWLHFRERGEACHLMWADDYSKHPYVTKRLQCLACGNLDHTMARC